MLSFARENHYPGIQNITIVLQLLLRQLSLVPCRKDKRNLSSALRWLRLRASLSEYLPAYGIREHAGLKPQSWSGIPPNSVDSRSANDPGDPYSYSGNPVGSWSHLLRVAIDTRLAYARRGFRNQHHLPVSWPPHQQS